MLPIGFDPFAAGRTDTPKAATAGADAGSSRTAPAGDGFDRLVRTLSGESDDVAESSPEMAPPAPLPPVTRAHAHELLNYADWAGLLTDDAEIAVAAATSGKRMSGAIDADELVAFLAELEHRAQSGVPADDVAAVSVPVPAQVPSQFEVTPVAADGTVESKEAAGVETALVNRKEEDLPAPEETKRRPAPPLATVPWNPKEDEDTTPASDHEDRRTKLPPLAPPKEFVAPVINDDRAAYVRATDASVASADVVKADAVPPRSFAARVAALAQSAAAPVSTPNQSTIPSPVTPPAIPDARTAAAPADARIGEKAAGAAIDIRTSPQTPDARRADETRVTLDRATSFARTSPGTSLNDPTTADRVDRAAATLFDTRGTSDSRPGFDRPAPIPVVHVPSGPFVPVTVPNATIVSTLARDGEVVAAQIVDAIRLQWTRGGGEAQVTLEPKYLGPLSVTVKIEKDVVSATVIAETPAVREWLRTNEALLRQGLNDQGLRLDRLEIAETSPQSSNRDRDAREEQSRDRDDRPRQPKRPVREDAVFEVVA